MKSQKCFKYGTVKFQDDGTVCGKAFSKLDSLRRHVNELHKGVRPFACSVCDKNYGRRDYLDRHMKTHDPETQSKRIKLTSNTAGKFLSKRLFAQTQKNTTFDTDIT